MRTDNGGVRNFIISVYFVLIVIAVLLATVFQSFDAVSDGSLYVFFGTVVIAVLVHAIARYFEYDSDGPKLIIINRGLLLSDYFNYREHKLEIDKQRLLGFRIKRLYIYNQLVILYGDRHDKKHKARFNVTLVKRRKLRYIRQSLSKIIKENKKSK
jgi:hypothetical protein